MFSSRWPYTKETANVIFEPLIDVLSHRHAQTTQHVSLSQSTRTYLSSTRVIMFS
jgi:hypothetical protein